MALPVPVTAVLRMHRGVPNLPLVSHEIPGEPVESRLHRPENRFDRGVEIDAKIVDAEQLEFDLSQLNASTADTALTLERTSSNGKKHTIPISIHVCSDTIVLVDRSARMLEQAAGACGSVWSTAVHAVDLFAELNALAAPDLVTAEADLPEPNRLALGTFFADREGTVVLGELKPGSRVQRVDADEPETYFGTALGAALERAAQAFPAASWRQRHIVVVTSGLDERDGASFDAHVAKVPTPESNPSSGVHVHVLVVGRAGETEDPRLWRLAKSHGGRYFNSATAGGSDDAELLEPFLNILQDLLPVEVTKGASERAVRVEAGVDHVLFAGRATGKCCEELLLENAGIPTHARKTRRDLGFVFSDTYLAVAGTWRIPADRRQRPLFALSEARLDFRTRASVDAASFEARVEALLYYEDQPIRGASVRAVAYRRSPLLGEKLSQFAREGGIAEALRRRTFDGAQFCSTDGDGSLRRALLDAYEASTNCESRVETVSILLHEETPGYYTASNGEVGPGVVEFRFRADGDTPFGTAFSRSAEATVLASAIPDAAGSFVWFDTIEPPDGKRSYQATVVFKASWSGGAGTDIKADIQRGRTFEMGRV